MENIILTPIPKSEFIDLIQQAVQNVLSDNSSLQGKSIDENTEDYEPRDETMKRLRVRSYATMIKYERLGFLKPYRLGRSIFYKKSEVDQSMIKFQRA